ncbi:MAG: dTDP-4-dehydrorhamnose 3,5-epimerase [Phycisphaerae bacterium]|nr:dTDP-4-dehydrorhamnose 3,5-epimerase [Phycisphaerae bacterium]
MEVTPTEIEGVFIIEPRRFGDERGWFCETYSSRDFAAAGIDVEFVQDNHAFSAEPNTVRGLHFQAPPSAQSKLLRVTHGSVLDVAVDIRRGSPSYGRHVAVELSGDNARQLFVPKGIAHGYKTLTPDCHVLYKVDGFYSRDDEGGLLWNDPALGIDWGGGNDAPVVNDRDASWPTLADLDSPF